MKVVLKILAVITGIILIGFGGCVGFVKSLGNSNSCKWGNIDNIELRAHFDIPQVVSDSCSCIVDKTDDSKTNYFKIRTDVVDMDRYVERNRFIAVNKADLDLSVFGKFSKIPAFTPENIQRYYYNSGYNPGKGKRTHWLAIVDKHSGDLWVHMIYREQQ